MTQTRISATDPICRSKLEELHHQLRSVLSAATLSIETAQWVDRSGNQQPTSNRSLERAMASLDEALRIAEEIRTTELAGLPTAAEAEVPTQHPVS